MARIPALLMTVQPWTNYFNSSLECVFLGEGNGNPLQYSCLENPMDTGAGQATVHGVTRVRHDLATKLLLCVLATALVK